jgi:hypothetical protein
MQFDTTSIKGTVRESLYIQLICMNRAADNDILQVDSFQRGDKSPHSTNYRDLKVPKPGKLGVGGEHDERFIIQIFLSVNFFTDDYTVIIIIVVES